MDGQTFHDPALLHYATKSLELAPRKDVGHFGEFEKNARIRPIAAIAVHGIGKTHPREGARQIDPNGFFAAIRGEDLEKFEHVLYAHKGHLQVDLGELQLAIRSLILVPKAACDLKIPLVTAHHEQLLHDLGRLGKRVEGARLKTARDQEIARAFGRRTSQHGRLDFQEAMLIERVSHGSCEFVPDRERSLQGRPPQVMNSVT